MSQRDITKLELVVEIEQQNGEDDYSFVTQSLDGKTELEPIVDRDLDAFAEFYQRALGNDKLSGFERAVIKTYIYWKTHPQKT